MMICKRTSQLPFNQSYCIISVEILLYFQVQYSQFIVSFPLESSCRNQSCNITPSCFFFKKMMDIMNKYNKNYTKLGDQEIIKILIVQHRTFSNSISRLHSICQELDCNTLLPKLLTAYLLMQNRPTHIPPLLHLRPPSMLKV